MRTVALTSSNMMRMTGVLRHTRLTTSVVVSSTSSLLASSPPLSQQQMSRRTFAKLSAPGLDPLEVLRNECFQRSLCDENGFRRPGVHWVFSVAVGWGDPLKAPSLRTLGVQRISDDGIDFVVKRGSGKSKSFASGRPVSILHTQGKYVAGEEAQQWRAEGHCEAIPLIDILDKVPHYTITGMVAAKRIAKEQGEDTEEERIAMQSKSHLTEIVQHTRIELENGDISQQELEQCIKAYRFHPDRIERMSGGPDGVLWDRWEWERSSAGDCPEGIIPWKEPKWLLPH